MRLAKRLEIGFIEEQGQVTIMPLDMIHIRGECMHMIIQTVHAPRMCSKLSGTQTPPSRSVIQASDFWIALNFLGGMSRAPPSFHKDVTAGVGAWPQRRIRHDGYKRDTYLGISLALYEKPNSGTRAFLNAA
jgi:hypothetical protein